MGVISWSIQILKSLGCNKCILIDHAEKKCNNWSLSQAPDSAINHAQAPDFWRTIQNYIPLSLIHKLWRNKTYYENFNFIPYDKNNNFYRNNKVTELNKYIKLLQELRWDDFNIEDEKWEKFKNNYSIIYPSPFLAYKEFTPQKCGIYYDILYLLDNSRQPSFELLQKVKNIITKSIWVKSL